MSKKLDDAIKHMEDSGYKLEKVGKNKYIASYWYAGKEYKEEHTSRSLIVFHRKCTTESGYKKSLKHNDKRYNRAETKQIIHHQQFDKLDKNKKAKSDNIWNHT